MRIVDPTPQNIQAAADALLDGQLVVIPTETVYGLAADAGNLAAVQAVFAAKGRPADNPLIVHIGSNEWMEDLAVEVPAVARTLAERFWPGPLTLVLKKKALVLPEVTGGLDTVAVRMPAHPVALELIRSAGIPLAAPSANQFTNLSPTRAQNVDPEIAARAEMVLDGGPCEVGLESTVVDCTTDPIRILRPGRISQKDIEVATGVLPLLGSEVSHRSPGQYPRHYAPKTPVCLVPKLAAEQGGLVLSELTNPSQVLMPSDPVAYAALLYETLHDLDNVGLSQIFVEMPPATPEWTAVWDRLKKASTP